MPSPHQMTDAPLEHYKSLFEKANPKALSERSGIPFDGEKFTIHLMNRPVYVYWPDMKTVFADNMQEPAPYTKILCARICLTSVITGSFGEFKAYTEMPWGNVYAQQFRGRCILRLAFSYGNNIQGFIKACESLGGTAVKYGDASFEIPFLTEERGKLSLRLTVWEGDDEFQPQAQVLFSDNFPSAFSAEDMAVVGDILINALKGRW